MERGIIMPKTLRHRAGYLQKGLVSNWLRTTFQSLLDEHWNADAPLPESFDVEGEAVPVRWLIRQLWNCRDEIPRHYVEMLELNRSTTYAAATRKVRDRMILTMT